MVVRSHHRALLCLSQIDPYRNFKFRLVWKGNVVAGVAKVSALKTRGAITGGAKPLPQAAFEPITFERGVTHDESFVTWARQFSAPGRIGGVEGVIPQFKRNFFLEMYDEGGRRAATYGMTQCWVSAFTAMPELDANANAVAIEALTLEHEGWQRAD